MQHIPIRKRPGQHIEGVTPTENRVKKLQHDIARHRLSTPRDVKKARPGRRYLPLGQMVHSGPGSVTLERPQGLLGVLQVSDVTKGSEPLTACAYQAIRDGAVFDPSTTLQKSYSTGEGFESPT